MILKHGSFFSGIGGFDISAEKLEIENVFNCEIDEFCRKVLKKNFPKTKQYKDIKDFSGHEYKNKIDIITGGFPCQDISQANRKGKGIKGERSGLFYELLRIIREINPRWVILENVPNLRSRGLGSVLGTLAEEGYYAEWFCLRASDFGLLHKRERMFIVANTDGFGVGQIFQKIKSSKNDLQNKIKKMQVNKTSIKNKLFNVLSRIRRRDNFKNDHFANGLPQELDKFSLKALGNAIVPICTEVIFKAILEIENDRIYN